MNKRFCIVMALLVCRCAGVWADELSKSQALRLAQQFVSGSQIRKSLPSVKPAGQVNGLYVFNVNSNGFVIVSNDDQTVPILAYGQNGNIDTNDMPDNMKAWLQGYADQIAWIRSQPKQDPKKAQNRVPQRRSAETKSDIAPMIATNWDQSWPYNNLCPTIGVLRTVTGCVATSLAQLMYFHQWPEASTAIPAYTTSTKDKDEEDYTLTVDALPATTFEWGNMIANYTPINPDTGRRYRAGTEAQQHAVAKLMQYCGAALQMNYGLSSNGGSSAYNEAIPYALKTCFGYDGGVRHCYRKNYSYSDWVDLIYGELAAGRPVALGGQSADAGHSFICDGYRYASDADYFHINWGWAGSSDAYFLLSVLNPYEQGIGGSSTLDGFSFGQDAVIGIQKPVDGNSDYCLSLEGLHLGSPDAYLSSKTYTRNDGGCFTGMSFYYDVWNYNIGSAAYDTQLRLVDVSGNMVLSFGGTENNTLSWNKHVKKTISNCSIPTSTDVADGTYYIKVMSRPTGATDWQECFDGDAYRLTAVISGNELTISVPIQANTTPTAVTFVVDGESETGAKQTVTATVTGGESNYVGNLILRVDGTAVMGQIARIPAEQSVDLTFSYIPSVVGGRKLTLWTHRSSGSQIPGNTTRNINTLVLKDNAASISSIKKNDGQTADVRIDGRTLYKDGEWNTICLPFDLTLDGSPLAGAEARTLGSADLTDGVLTLNFDAPVAKLMAGTPYIIKWTKAEGYDNAPPAERDIVNPVFEDVTIEQDFSDFVSADENVRFLGCYTSFTYTEEIRNTLLLGADNTLYFPQPTVEEQTGNALQPTIGAFRAYFWLEAEAAIKAYNIAFDEMPSGIDEIESSRMANGRCYDLNGRQLNSKPTAKGVYIQRGRKIVVQ